MATANVDAGYKGVVSENVFKEVLAQRAELAVIDGGRMVPPANDTSYYAGQVVSQLATGANAGLWTEFDASQKNHGVIYGGADIGADGSGSEIRVITKGLVYADLLVVNGVAGSTDAVVSALGGKLKLVHGQRVIDFN
jgi:hypothetical protein